VQITRGAVSVNGTELKAGDGAALSNEKEIRAVAIEAAELLLFGLA